MIKNLDSNTNKHQIISSSNQKLSAATAWSANQSNANKVELMNKHIPYKSDFMTRLLSSTKTTNTRTTRRARKTTRNSNYSVPSVPSVSSATIALQKTNLNSITSSSNITNTNTDTNTSTDQKTNSDFVYDLSLIRSNEKVVLYSMLARTYVCLNLECEDDEKGDTENRIGTSSSSSSSSLLYLKCDDMEGVPLLIGETQFSGTCKFLTDCKIQLVTGQGLAKDRNRIVISKHATKFMLQRKDNPQSACSMRVGHPVFIFIEASRNNHKQFWSFDHRTESILLKEVSVPGINETFILQKCGQPLIFPRKTHRYNDGVILNKFFTQSSVYDQEYYMCHDILKILARTMFNGDFISFVYDCVHGLPKVEFKGHAKFAVQPLIASAVDALKPIIENTAQVRYFVTMHSSSQYGVISQALCAEISSHLKDFNLLLVQLETKLTKNELALQNMQFYLQRASRSIATLQNVCYTIHINQQKHITPTLMSTFASSVVKSSIFTQKTTSASASASALASLCMGCRGGALLNVLQQQIEISGEKHACVLYTKLMKACCVPYFEMLGNWIYRGSITDVYGEFMIQEKSHLKKENVAQEYNDEYWTGRYTLNRQQIPAMLFEFQDIIVTTGKYLNVMRESGYSFGDDNCNDLQTKIKLLLKCHPRQLGQYISEAYNFASKALLEMLMNREQILARFSSIKRYMLISEGDWFDTFLDMSIEMLSQSVTKIKIAKLNRLLELSVRISISSKNDLFKDDVECDLKNKDLKRMVSMLYDMRQEYGNDNDNNDNNDNDSQSIAATNHQKQIIDSEELRTLTGVQAFALDYKVQWPSSIIFTGRNVIRYQLIFRFLFKLKLVSRKLNESWAHQMMLREFDLYNSHNNSSLILRHKMIAFMNNLLFYISYQVIEPNYNTFMTRVQNKSTTIDGVLHSQNQFLRSTLEKCLLTDKSNLESLFQILLSCEGYAQFVSANTLDQVQLQNQNQNFQHTAQNTQNRKATINVLENDCRKNISSQLFVKSIQNYSKQFEQAVRKFLHLLQHNSSLNMTPGVLLSRLDFNGYYICYT